MGRESRKKNNVRKHLVILGLGNVRNRLLEHLAHRVDDNVDLAKVVLDRLEEALDGLFGRQVCLVKLDEDIGVLLLELGRELVGRRLGLGRVVVQRQARDAERGQLAGDFGAEVLGSAGDEGDFSVERHAVVVRIRFVVDGLDKYSVWVQERYR